jgi:hypothetical protein
MFGMMQLSAKTPSKNQDNQDKEEKMFNKGESFSAGRSHKWSGVSTKDRGYNRNRGRIHDDIFVNEYLK